jgi:L-seryl-tRNA(Ser) seleniumtransferase
MSKKLFRLIPSVNDFLADQDVSGLLEDYPRNLVLRNLNILLEELREKIRQESVDEENLQSLIDGLPGKLNEILHSMAEPTLKPVINATGIIIYTNVGRAPVSRKIAEEFTDTICSYSNLEYDIEKGSRGHRDVHFESRITRIMGCEAASVCNNAAAALLIILNTLAHDKNVIISRGELVEIGGSFRIPEILKKSGAQLREIGTTNRTFLSDYENAIDKDTGLILKVHTGNYQITGFTSEAGIPELAELSASRNIPLVHDAGSGMLFPSEEKCLEHEPSIKESLDAGADLVCFSGDKLLGGPQAGIIVGKQKYVSLIRKNPLMRVLRIDKVICSLLDRTMLEFEMGREEVNIPVRKFISIPLEEIEKRAKLLAGRISNPEVNTLIKPGFSKSGGGSSPGGEIPTFLVALISSGFSAASIERYLRSRDIPILARIEKELVLIDLRTVFPEQDQIISEAINALV